MDSLPSIDLELPRKLRDREYRRRFFLSESSARIAKQLIELRKRRGLNQTDLAKLADTGQPAISRAERADYCNWSFNTLRKLAEAMDARIRVLIEAAEDVLPEYEAEANMPRQLRASAATEMADVRQRLPSQSAATAITRHAIELPAMSKEYGISHDRKQSSYLSHSDASSERTTVPA
jgi:transcriptional regulator with XRE-family HTH domain